MQAALQKFSWRIPSVSSYSLRGKTGLHPWNKHGDFLNTWDVVTRKSRCVDTKSWRNRENGGSVRQAHVKEVLSRRRENGGKSVFSPLPFPLGMNVLRHCFHRSCLDSCIQSQAWTKQWHRALVKHLFMLEHLLEASLFFYPTESAILVIHRWMKDIS